MEWLRRTGIKLDTWVQRKLTPESERALLEGDLVRQQLAGQEETPQEADTVEPTPYYTAGIDPQDTLSRIMVDRLLRPNKRNEL